MSKTVVLVATLDTKGAEARYLKKQMEKHGVRTLVWTVASLQLRSGQAWGSRNGRPRSAGRKWPAWAV